MYNSDGYGMQLRLIQYILKYEAHKSVVNVIPWNWLTLVLMLWCSVGFRFVNQYYEVELASINR